MLLERIPFVAGVSMITIFLIFIFLERCFFFSVINADHDAIVHFIIVVKFILSIGFSYFIAEFDYSRILDCQVVTEVSLEVFIRDC